ncbi:surface anchored protein [Streptococcus pneumoniae]|nr:surface anchored protein [Streptococcus pneumoniae]
MTDDEKKAAKDAAKDAADKAKEAIDAAPSNAEVDKAKEAGTGAVEAINPEAKAKPEAKQAIDDALKAKEAAIDARTDLTDDEKKAAKDAAKDAADKAKEAIDAAPSNAEVDKAKEAGTGEIAKVNPVAKEAAKKAVADELKAKEAEIAGRNDLTDEEKAKAKEEAQAKAKEATDAIDAQPNNAETPEKAAEAQTAVDGAKDKGVADVKAVDPEAKAKPAAKKAIEDKLAKQLEDIANTPDATDDEKKVAADAAKALADEAKKEIDNAKKDADVAKLQDEAEKEIEKSVPVVEDKPNARKAIEDEAKAKKEAIDARTDLTPKAKEDLKAQVDAIADQAKKSVDAAKTSEAVDGIEESDKAAIKAVGEVNIPADKVLVNNPSALTDDEKAKVLEAVKKVNPDAKEITQDADGNVTVTTPDGHKEIITPEQVVKTAATANDPKAGNDIVKPADKVVVNDPAKLTDAEKEKIKAAVEAVNPNSIVVVDDKGNAKVSTPDGQTQVIPVEELVRTVEDTKKPNAGNDIVKPADKTVVANPEKLTDTEKKAIEDKVKAVNPDATVVVDDKGNTTVTTPEGKTAVIPAADLTKDPETATKPNAGNDIVKPADKTAVKDPANLTPEEKKAIEDKVKAVNPGATVVVDDKGNATVTTPEGKTAVIPATDLTKDPEAATKPNAGNDIVKPADKTAVKDPANLTPEEKKAIEDKVKAVNPGATVVVDDKGNTTVTTPEGKTAVIPAADLTKDPETATKSNAGNDIVKPADKTAVKDPANLTPEEKKAIEDKVKAVNPGATVVVDDKGNATVTTPEGKTAVIPAADLTKDPETATKPNAGNDIVKPADKTAVKDPANLTPEEKKAIEDKVKAVNPGATVVVDDKGNATVTTPEGKTAVIPATDLTKSPADAAKANAGNTVNTPAAKVEVKDPAKLTDEEKAKVKEAIEAVNPGSKVVVDDKGNATVTTPEGDVVVIPTTDLTKSPADAGKANAGNAVNTPAAKVEVKDPAKLTDEEKAKVKKAVEDVNPGSKVVVDDKGNTTVTTSEGKTATIPAADVTKSAADAGKANAGNAVNTPAAKVEVKDPANLTDAEKKAIEDKVKAVNPGSKVVVDDKGNVTVTTPEGKTATIPAADVTKSAADAGKANAGNGANTPATKTVVKDPAKLTDEEKAKVKKAVEDVNPGSTVVVNDKGDVIVTKGDGTVLVIPELDLVIPEDKLTDPTQQNGVNTPATRVLVGDKAKLTADEIEKVKESIKAVNPGSTVVVDDKGNATVTTPEGKTATIPAAQLVKDAKDVAAKNNGENINVDFEKETVADFNNLTDAEKEAAKAKIKGANADVVEVIFDKAGNATVITKDGKVYTIVAKDIFKQRPYVPSNGGGNNSGNGNGTSGNNGATNTDAKVDKAKLEGAIRQLDELIVKESAKLDAETAKEANALLADAKKVFANADASQAEVDAMVKRIEGFMAKVASSTDHATPANDQAAQTPAVDTATTQAASAQANARKVAKELPNTGTADSTVAMVAAAASALLGLGLAGRRRKEDEEA